jgi:hypothetical protein
MRKSSIRSIVATSLFAFAALTLTGGSALAGDCKAVKFKFVNQTGAKIKVKSATIKGNDGTWTEDFANKSLDTNASHTTGGQNLNKLDSGASGDFTINYERFDAPNDKYVSKSQKFSDRKCTDNITFTFNLTNK